MASGDSTNRIAVTFDAERCLHARSIWACCSLCVDSCPGRAIRMTEGGRRPAVDSSRCLYCGQCLSACPLEAFTSPRFSERQLFNRIAPAGDVRLRCFLPYGELDLLGSERETYQLGACLAMLTPGALFELALSRSCELATGGCRSCSLFERLAQTMQCNVAAAYGMLQDWGRQANLVESSQLFLPSPAEDAGDRGAAGGRRESAARDDALGDVRASIRSLFHGKRGDGARGEARLPLRSKRRHVPAWRRRLQDAWGKRASNGSERFPWPVLEVDGARCRACGMCMQLCPTGSIRHAMADGSFSYAVVPGTCVDCGLCVASCAARALSRSYRPLAQPFDAHEVFSQRATPCPRCGMPVLKSQDGPRCFLCTSEPDKRALVERVRRQMSAILHLGAQDAGGDGHG